MVVFSRMCVQDINYCVRNKMIHSLIACHCSTLLSFKSTSLHCSHFCSTFSMLLFSYCHISENQSANHCKWQYAGNVSNSMHYWGHKKIQSRRTDMGNWFKLRYVLEIISPKIDIREQTIARCMAFFVVQEIYARPWVKVLLNSNLNMFTHCFTG